jgi:hypothetical protein
MNEQVESTACCPKFDTAPWDGSTHVWEDKLFIRDSIRQFLHILLLGYLR